MTVSLEAFADEIVTDLFLNGYISSSHLVGARIVASSVCDRYSGDVKKEIAPLNDFLVRELPAMSEKEYFEGINQE